MAKTLEQQIEELEHHLATSTTDATEKLKELKERKTKKDQKQAELAAQKVKEFKGERARNYRQNYLEPVNKLREEFANTLHTGKDPLSVWIEYTSAIERAADEERYIAENAHTLAMIEYGKIANEVRSIAAQLQTLAQKAQRSVPTAAQLHYKNPRSSDQPRLSAQDTELRAQLVARLREIARENGSDISIPDDFMGQISPLQLGVSKPPQLLGSLGDPSRFEERTYAQALEELIAERRRSTLEEHKAQRENQRANAINGD